MIKKIIKRLLVSILVLIILIFAVVAIVLNYVFTPEKITPIVNDIAKEYVKSDINIGRVDLTFFSTFPNFSAQIDSLTISQDSVGIPDFISAKRCVVTFNPFAFLNKKIVINRVLLEEPDIYIYVDSTYRSLSVFAFEQDSIPSDTTETRFDYQLIVRGVEIDSSVVTIDDRIKEFYTKLDGFSMMLDGDLNDEIVEFDLFLDWKNLLVWQKNEVFLNKVSLSLNSEMTFVKDSLLLSLERTDLKVNDIALTANGTIKGDSIAKSIDINISSALSTPSLSDFLDLIPEAIVDSKNKIETKGSVDLLVDINGVYSANSMPNITAKLDIKDGQAKYQSKKLSIDDVDCDAELVLNFNQPRKSYIDINNIHINSSDILDITVKGRVNNILKNPAVNVKVNSNIYFDRLIELFPLQEGIVFKGKNHSSVDAVFTLEDIEKSNYGKIFLNGESVFNDLLIVLNIDKITKDSTDAFIYVEMTEGVFLFGNKVKDRTQKDISSLASSINFSGLGFKDKKGKFVYIRDLKLSAEAQFNKETKQVNGLSANLELQKINAGIDKEIDMKMESSIIKLSVLPEREQKAIIEASIRSDSILLTEVANNTDLRLSLAGIKLTLIKNKDVKNDSTKLDVKNDSTKLDVKNDSTKLDVKNSDARWSLKNKEVKWHANGQLGFSNLIMYSDLFPLKIEVPATNVIFDGNRINLSEAHLRMGHSDLVATGYVENLLKMLFSTEENIVLNGKLAISSKMLNIGEFIEATNKSVLFSNETAVNVLPSVTTTDTTTTDTIATDTIATNLIATNLIASDSVPNPMILVPNNVNLDLDLDINTMRYDELEVNNFIGKAKIKDGVLFLNELSLEVVGAKAFSSMVYRNISHVKSHMYVDLLLSDIDINRIGNLMPSIDSMMPMLRSLEGNVNFNFKASTGIDKYMNLDIPSLKGAIGIEGKDLVLMDSETFKEMSKMLMFKNKKRNIINALSIQVMADKSRIDVLPFNVAIDRYKAIIGGTQTVSVGNEFKIDFKYNISIMKSPLPFKAGVDIFGDMNDFDFKITKAKLKKTDFEAQDIAFEKFKKSIKP